MGYDEDLADSHSLHNSFLLLEIESKIPIFAVRQWSDEKRKKEKAGKEANIEDFIEFYERIVQTNEDVVYARTHLED